MTPLRELQRDLRAALLGADDAAAAAAVRDDGLSGAARLGIYRHHVFVTLTAALAAAFPVVCRLVDERFFGYAADRYIRTEPPAGPCLFAYGATFPAFLAEFPPCHALPYLADVARLEWAMQRALDAPDATPLAADALRSAPPERACDLIFTLDPSVALLASPWPIDRIWRANQPAAESVKVSSQALSGGADRSASAASGVVSGACRATCIAHSSLATSARYARVRQAGNSARNAGKVPPYSKRHGPAGGSVRMYRSAA